MCSPKSLHNLQHDEGGNYMAEAHILGAQALVSGKKIYTCLNIFVLPETSACDLET